MKLGSELKLTIINYTDNNRLAPGSKVIEVADNLHSTPSLFVIEEPLQVRSYTRDGLESRKPHLSSPPLPSRPPGSQPLAEP